MNLSKEGLRKTRGLIVFTVLMIMVFWQSELVLGLLSRGISIVFPFILGAAIAFIINVPMSFVEAKIYEKVKIKEKWLTKFARPVSLILTLIFLLSILALVIFVVLPQLTITVASFGENLQVFLPEVADKISKLFVDYPEISTFILTLEYDWNTIVQTALSFVQSGAINIFDTTITVAFGLISAFTTFFIGLIFAVYIIVQKEELGMQLRKICFAFMRKGRAEATIEVGQLTYKIFSNFLTGQCMEAIIIGCIIMLTMTIFRIPYALLIGILVGFTALIPIFGAFVGCIVGAFIIFIDDPIKAITFVILFLIVQQIEGNLIYPHVVGNSVGLPSIWVLVAVSVGASLMGVVGMLIFIPITSVAYTLFREVVYIKLKKNEIDPKDIEEKKIG